MIIAYMNHPSRSLSVVSKADLDSLKSFSARKSKQQRKWPSLMKFPLHLRAEHHHYHSTGWEYLALLRSDAEMILTVSSTNPFTGTVIGFIISYRTSSAYAQYTEARCVSTEWLDICSCWFFFLNGYRRAWGTIMHQSRTLGRVIWLHLPDELTPSSGETSAADKDVSEYHPLITMNILPPSGIDRYGSVCYDAPILLLTRLTRLQYQRVKPKSNGPMLKFIRSIKLSWRRKLWSISLKLSVSVSSIIWGVVSVKRIFECKYKIGLQLTPQCFIFVTINVTTEHGIFHEDLYRKYSFSFKTHMYFFHEIEPRCPLL